VAWLIDGILQFQPYMFAKTFVTGVIMPNTVGQPGVIATPITWIAHQIEPHVALFNAFAATAQVLIGLGLLYPRTVKPALLASFAWALAVWFSGEGLGGIFTGDASPLTGAPGAALLYVLVGLMCWPTSSASDTDGERSARLGLIGELKARVIFGALWVGLAALWLFPANDGGSSVHDTIAEVPSGAGWLTDTLNSAASATSGLGTAIAVAMAIVSCAIGIALWRGWHVATFLSISIAVSLIFWVFGQGFGGVLTGEATDVGSAPLMILFAAMLLAVTPRAGSRVAHQSVPPGRDGARTRSWQIEGPRSAV
jgi:hypothetical protein